MIKVHSYESMGTYDGPGLRLVVFLQGCPFRCLYCANPDTITFDGGTPTEVEEIVKMAISQKPFFGKRGGVTFSGGEPMLALPFLKEVLIKCKEHELRTAVDTAGCVSFDHFEEVMPYTDVFLFDMKIWDDEKHQKYTGVSNVLIKENIRKLSENGKRIYVRIPIIGSVNDSLEELAECADFLKELETVELVQLLKYHTYGVGKYDLIDMENDQAAFYTPSAEFMEQALEVFRERGINVSF
jgi:pyruvate formate lyase activating enzyme